MGIAISYSGSLNDVASLDHLIADVRLFSQAAGWKFDELTDIISGIAQTTPEDFMEEQEERKSTPVEEWPEEETFREGPLTMRFDSKNPNLIEDVCRGIMVHPPDTESFLLTFDLKGRLCKYVNLPHNMVKGKFKDLTHYLCFPLFCKTWDVEQHIALCVLLKMLRNKYIENLQVFDDTDYYTTGDVSKLRDGHTMMAGLIGALKNNPGFLTGLLKAAGMSDEEVKGATMLPSEIEVTHPPATKAKKNTVH